MILPLILFIGLTFTPTNATNNTLYKYEAILTSQNNKSYIQVPDNTNLSYAIESNIEFGFNMAYNNNQEYLIYDVNFYVTANLYYWENNQRYVDTSINLRVLTNWEITQNTLTNPLSLVNFRVGMDSANDNLFIRYYYAEELISSNNKEADGSWDERTTSYLNLTLDTNYIMSQAMGYANVSDINTYNDGYNTGYQDGYTDGYTLGSNQDETATAIFVGIINVALVPINFFLAMLNFKVFGINIGSMVSALLTIAIIVIIIRTIIGGNKSD